MNRALKRSTLLILFIYFFLYAGAQEKGSDDFYLFGSDEVLEVSLKFDMTTYIRKKPKDEYMDAELVYHLGPKDSLVNKIRLRSRGNSRNEMCIMPPIRLNFKKCDNSPRDLEGVSNVKLVTHCKNNHTFEDYVLKEYLAYKLYNVVTDTSFRVRLMHIKYVDTGSKGYERYRYGFVIEPVDLLSSRLAAVEKEDIVVRTAFIEHISYDRLCLFQYMIGNDDWHLANLHNLKLIEPLVGNKSRLAAVPYDFDYSGLVNTYYALPNELYGLEKVQERVYVGPCRTDENIHRHIKFFLDHKEDFYLEIEKMNFVNENQKKRTLKYIDSFFDEYKRDRLFYNIKRTCVK